MLELYKRIRLRREELGMSQEELAMKLGYKSRSSINKIEMGGNDIPQSKIKAFANALQTTPSYLMGWDNRPTASDSEKLPQDLRKFLMEETITFNGEVMSLEDKLLVEQMLTTMYQRAKDLNKRDK